MLQQISKLRLSLFTFYEMLGFVETGDIPALTPAVAQALGVDSPAEMVGKRLTHGDGENGPRTWGVSSNSAMMRWETKEQSHARRKSESDPLECETKR